MSTPQLRQSIRRQRRDLSPDAAAHCARQLAHHARHNRLLTGSRHIAAYLAADGEMDPLPLMHALWALGKRIYLPVLVTFSHQKLWFAKFEPGDELVYNRYVQVGLSLFDHNIFKSSNDLIITVYDLEN